MDRTLQFVHKQNFEVFHSYQFGILDAYVHKMKFETKHGIVDNEVKRFYKKLFEKLKPNGYIKDINPSVGGEFEITVEGIMFLQGAGRPYKNMPYTYENYKAKWRTAWNIAKTVSIAFNALLLLWFAYLQIHNH